MALLTVNNLTLNLNGITKLDNISFSLHPGERVALIGASGSGKSLTARALLGLPLTGSMMSGDIHFSGQNRLAQQPRIAAIFQDTSAALHPLIGVGKQLVLVLRANGATSARAAWEAGITLLATAGFSQPEHIAHRYPGELSGGQRQRVCIAPALASQSALLIADEPTTALDVITQAQVLQALKTYTSRAPERALLFITHDIAVAAALCSRALILSDGKIVEQGTIDALVRYPQHPYTVALMTAARQQRQLVSQNALALAG
ncbi:MULTISPECIES: ATP-binding cassette domain-containing protein [Symbiopectobacterium]|uniref:ATP-binding cassette domain-containing protein n=1 Tax=Symbiopectobacterium TaxID=801 RepID=UPI001A1E1CE6|nr:MULTISPECIES: ABC transporter ATP-binding protein [Symbiopectobacterium]MBG6247917.1 ABC transporter ATP-binding protein [Candidatus Symbiopectobacterium sp. PLON1]MBT9428512.1 ABC transporter ATP-binding protein [Candidatus Symbiopectobacterium endolongispinus]